MHGVWVGVSVQVANEAFQREKKDVKTKSSGADLVTETDKKVEDLIFSFLREKFPSHWYSLISVLRGRV